MTENVSAETDEGDDDPVDGETEAERVERVRRQVSMNHEVAQDLDVEEGMNFPDIVNLDDYDRRKFLAGSGAAGLAAIAGCIGGDEEEDPDPEEDDDDDDEEVDPDPDEDDDDDEEEEEEVEEVEIDMVGYQYGWAPQEFHVPEGAEVTINFVASTFEEDPSFTVHDWHLLDPYDIQVVLEEDWDEDTVQESITFTADEPGVHQYECSIYCGSGHAQMDGWMLVGEDAETFDYRNIEDIQQTHTVYNEEEDLPQSPELADDVFDLAMVIERDAGDMSYMNMETDEDVGRIEDVGHAVHVCEFHRDLDQGTREGAYTYTMGRDGRMLKLDAWGLNRVAEVQCGADARDLALSRDSQYLIGGMYNPGQLVVIDADTMEPIKVIPTEGIDLDGQYVESRVCAIYDAPEYGVFVAAMKELGEVWLVDYTQDDFPVVATIDAARTLHDGFFTPDGRYFMIASQTDDVMSIIDVEQQERVTNIPSGAIPHPGPGAMDPESGIAYTTTLGGDSVVTAWQTGPEHEDFEHLKDIDVPGGGLFLREHEDCDYIWCDVALRDDPELDGLMYAIDREELEVVDDLVVDTGSAHSVHPIFSNDGQKVFISHWPEGEIHAYDSHTGEYLTMVEDGYQTAVGKFPLRRAEKFKFGASYFE